MKKALVLILIFIGAALAFGTGSVPNLQQPRFNIYTAGQPDEQGFQDLADLGIKTVINVLPEKECLPDEPGMVAAKKMAYVSLPFETSGFKMDTITRFASLLQKEEQPILIHCSTGNHVAGLWFAYRVLVEKAPIAPALKEARRIGLQPELENSLFDWVVSEQEKLTSK